MLHRLKLLDADIRAAYLAYDYNKVVAALSLFMTRDLSAFYFDIRRDALYCDPASSLKRRASLTCIEAIFKAVTIWLAPILCFTAEEAWTNAYPGDDSSVHLQTFPDLPESWRDDELAKRWEVIRNVRSAVTGALEIERAAKRIGSSLEAAPVVHVTMEDWAFAALQAVDFAEICITSAITLVKGEGPATAFRLPDLPHVAVMPARAPGVKCARSWKYFDPATADDDYPDMTPRDAKAMREREATAKA
jgi:isoleucyl-tRNA synthetase